MSLAGLAAVAGGDDSACGGEMGFGGFQESGDCRLLSTVKGVKSIPLRETSQDFEISAWFEY